MIRRDFLRVIGGGALAVAACGDDGEPVPVDAPPSCAEHGAVAVIGSNHGHAMVVTAADVNAGAEHEYDITGGADHAHTATVTAAAFATLASNGPVTVTSSFTDGHAHTISLRCR